MLDGIRFVLVCCVVNHLFSFRFVPFRCVPFIFARSCSVGIIAINLCVCSLCVVVFVFAVLLALLRLIYACAVCALLYLFSLLTHILCCVVFVAAPLNSTRPEFRYVWG